MKTQIAQNREVQTHLTKRRRSRRRVRRYRVLSCLLLLLLGVASALSLFGYQVYEERYNTAVSQAQSAMQHLQKAEALVAMLSTDPLNAQTVNKAQLEFGATLRPLIQLNHELQSLPGLSTSIPTVGTRLKAASHLIPLAIATSQAGIASCTILSIFIARFHNAFNSQGQGLTQDDFNTIHYNFRQIQAAFITVSNEIHQLQPTDVQFNPRIEKLIDMLYKEMPLFQSWLTDAEQFLSVAPTVLGVHTPAHYLIEVLDSTELRPDGGFIGNYGIATLSDGHMTAAHITDVDLLDQPFTAAGKKIAFPPAYSWFDLAPNWSLRDTGLDADFPTVARYSEQNYAREGGTAPVDGVIAITPALIEHAIAITGPIYVPEYQETVTSQNLIAQIHYHQLGAAGEGSDRIASPDGHSSLRKRFTELLAEHFLEHVHQLPSSASSKFVQLLMKAMHTKDIQVYVNSNIMENILHKYHLDASIQAPQNDNLFVVDANIAGNKANSFITNTLDDTITLDEQGNAVHHATLNYAWTTAGPVYGNVLYQDYTRMYVPNGSILQAQDGWQERGTYSNFNHEVWVGYFTLTHGQTRTITLTWTTHYAATNDGTSWHYTYLIQHQAGTSWMVYTHMTLPPCATISGTSGKQIAYHGRTATLSQSMNEDINVGLDYTCH